MWNCIACSLFKRLLRCCYFRLGPHWKCHLQHFLLQVAKRSQSVHGLWILCHLLNELTWNLFSRDAPRNNSSISLQTLNIDAVLKLLKEHWWLSPQILASGISADWLLFGASWKTHIQFFSYFDISPIASRSYIYIWFCASSHLHKELFCETTTVWCSDPFPADLRLQHFYFADWLSQCI